MPAPSPPCQSLGAKHSNNPTNTPSTSWSRGGCITCKKRRKKCDQTRPTCLNCEKRLLVCEGYQQLFRFVKQSIHERPAKRRGTEKGQTSSRKLNASPTIPSTTTIPAPQYDPPVDSISPSELPWDSPLLVDQPLQTEVQKSQLCKAEDDVVDTGLQEALAATEPAMRDTIPAEPHALPCSDSINADACSQGLDEVQDYTIGGLLHLEPGGVQDSQAYFITNPLVPMIGGFLNSTGLLGLPQSMSSYPSLSDQDFYYLQYLDEQAATQLLNMDTGASNPLRRLILPRAIACPGVLYSICAVAACHKAQRADPDTRVDLFVTATNFYVKSVNWLRSTFKPETGSSNPASSMADDASIITTLLLCKYEIIKGSATHWKDHLDGLGRMLNDRGGARSLELECGQYVASFLRYHRLVSNISHCENSPSSDDDDDLDAVASSTLSLDAYSGCAHHLLQACHSIAQLAGRLELDNSVTFDEFLNQTKHIVTSLGTSIIEPVDELCLTGIKVAQISRILYVAQRTRYAAFVFLHTVVDEAVRACNFDAIEEDELLRLIPYTKAQAIGGCLEMLAETPVEKHCEFAGLALPLFLSGCEVEDDYKRYLILEKLFAIERSFGLGHIARAKDCLMLIWQQEKRAKGKTWWKRMREMGWHVILC